METGLTVEVDDAEFQAKLQNVMMQLGTQSAGLMRAIGYYMERSTARNFQKESDPEGKAWEPLAESTVARPHVKGATRAGGRRMILHGRSGDLRKKIQSRSDAQSVEIGTNVFYGIFHQGEDPDAYYSAPRAHIPRRAFLGVADEDMAGIENLAWDYLVRVMG